ncbi:MAG: cobalamin biosynthesis protein CobD [Deltaproteobacteria bacterium]|nr:cobalamin biosynthesis protein CobD [Deltaproteobacteria bacterium]
MPDISLLSPPFSPFVLILAYLLDISIGDPERFPHPVRWIGAAITALEGVVRRLARTPRALRLGGGALVIIVVGLAYAIALGVLHASYSVSPVLSHIASLAIVWWCLSIKSLKTEARKVVNAFNASGVEGARASLSRIVGRDTAGLSKDGVMRSTIETVAENTSDGVVAPLFYLAIGGPALMLAYKAVNTADSMIGYKNERYRDLGIFGARLDDVANYIPARLTGLLVVSASFILGYNWRGSLRIFLRDGGNHPSPNSGRPEAAVAGALGLRLGGGSYYGGVFIPKPTIGDALGAPDESAVLSAIRLMEASALIMATLAFASRATMIIF